MKFTRIVLVAAIIMFAGPLLNESFAEEATISGTKISYSIPNGFKRASCASCAKEEVNCVGFIRQSATSLEEDCSISITIVQSSLKEAIEQNGCFGATPEGWKTNCGQGIPVDAENIKGEGWEGIFANTVCGMTDEAGYHAAGANCSHAVISNGKISLNVEVADILGDLSEKVSKTIVKSIRIPPEQQSKKDSKMP